MICPRCKERERDGKRAYCKECQRAYAREYYAAHPEKWAERNKKNRDKYEADPDKYASLLEYKRKYHREHREEENAWRRGYRAYRKMLRDQEKKQIDAVAGYLRYAATVVNKEN